MSEKCVKEDIINQLITNQNETKKDIREIKDQQTTQTISLNDIKNAIDGIISYQVSEHAKDISNLKTRVNKLEGLGIRVVAWASIGGVIGGFIFQMLLKFAIK